LDARRAGRHRGLVEHVRACVAPRPGGALRTGAGRQREARGPTARRHRRWWAVWWTAPS
jgi:hypothetical protein